MSLVGAAMADAAIALIGTPFRLQGRDPATGLDCVGLVLASMAAAGRTLAFPAHYGLRNSDISAMLGLVDRMAAIEVSGATSRGDILLVTPGPAQHHLLVATGAHSCVHAHAGLRRVIEAPLPAPWPTLRHWRLT